jgi:hypothetical protein
MKHIILLLSFSVLCLGCSQNVRVSGTVTFEDGSPVKSGTVKFETDAYLFDGAIKNGAYNAGVTKQGRGIPPGTYKVFLANTARLEALINAKGQVVEKEVVLFPQVTQEFTLPNKTPLTLEVKSGVGRITYDITVKRHPQWDKQQKYQRIEGAGIKTANEK